MPGMIVYMIRLVQVFDSSGGGGGGTRAGLLAHPQLRTRSMETLLSSCNLSHLAPSFAEQELTLPLLRSMAGAPAHWEDSMEELGVHAAESARLQQALLLAQAGAASTGVESGAGTATRAPSSRPPATFAQASISDLVASALSIVAATPAAPVAATAAEKPYRQGFSVTHINHVAPLLPKDSGALAAYKRRQLQQEVQQASSAQAQAQRGGPASKPQARYSPAPPYVLASSLNPTLIQIRTRTRTWP